MQKMSPKTEVSNLDGLVPKINEEHRLCFDSVRAGLQHAINCGDLLMSNTVNGYPG
jgi:hypothetical protein